MNRLSIAMYHYTRELKHTNSVEIKNFAVDKTGFNPVAFKVVVINEIPKNDSGKIRYKELVQYY